MKLWTEKASKESENQAPKSKSKEYIWSILHLSHGDKRYCVFNTIFWMKVMGDLF